MWNSALEIFIINLDDDFSEFPVPIGSFERVVFSSDEMSTAESVFRKSFIAVSFIVLVVLDVFLSLCNFLWNIQINNK